MKIVNVFVSLVSLNAFWIKLSLLSLPVFSSLWAISQHETQKQAERSSGNHSSLFLTRTLKPSKGLSCCFFSSLADPSTPEEPKQKPPDHPIHIFRNIKHPWVFLQCLEEHNMNTILNHFHLLSQGDSTALNALIWKTVHRLHLIRSHLSCSSNSSSHSHYFLC